MNLLDHFHPPLYPARHWEAFHGQWATSIAAALNGLLPRDYYAEPQVHVGSRVEVDVATFEHSDGNPGGANGGDSNAATATAVATAPAARTWSPPAAMLELPAIFPDSLEVLVINAEAGVTLVAAIELVSPANKYRPEARRAFAAKCAAYLQQGVGLIVIDVVTNRNGNMHNELIDLMRLDAAHRVPDWDQYTTGYRPRRTKDADRIDVWAEPLAVGGPLVTMPLALDKGQCVPVDLAATYAEACQRSRLPT